MKTMTILLLISVWAVSLTSCKEDEPKTVEVPFKAEFYSVPGEDAFDETCFPPTSERDFWGKDHQVGEGTATQLGKFKYDGKFCFHVVLDENGNPDFDGGFGEYKEEGLEGYFEAANGDRLFISTPEGLVFPSKTPGYRLEFHDPAYITGGTGRFEGASGTLQANGFVGENQTDHEWEGTLTLPKGN